MEGAATTVYAQGGRGNSRLVAWEGERTITFTMEDALISPAGFMILSGAGLIEAGETDVYGNKKTIKVHTTEQTDAVAVTLAEGSGAFGTENYNVNSVVITVESKPYEKDDEGHLVAKKQKFYKKDVENDEETAKKFNAALSAKIAQEDLGERPQISADLQCCLFTSFIIHIS